MHTIPDEDLVGRPGAVVWEACLAEHRMLVAGSEQAAATAATSEDIYAVVRIWWMRSSRIR